MRTFICTPEQSHAIDQHANGTFYLYPDWTDNEKTCTMFIGRKMPNGRVFIGYGHEIEMYAPGEYEEVAE